MKNYSQILKNIINTVNEDMLTGQLNLSNADNSNTLIINADFEKYHNDVFKMLVASYQNIGGLKSYKNLNDFLDRKHFLKIVLDKHKCLLACATYRKIENSWKMVAIGCIQNRRGKEALQQIVMHDIQDIDMHYWAEVSGAIEHYFKKYNGYPMPNVLASEILHIDENKIRLSKEDNVHYDRKIALDNEYYTKMIFGVKSPEIFEKAIAAVDDYEAFMNSVNHIDESIVLNQDKCRYTPKQAIYIIENLYRLHDEGFNELIPKWHNALNDSIESLKYAKTHHLYNDEWINDYLKYGDYLLRHMPLLQLHKLDMKQS